MVIGTSALVPRLRDGASSVISIAELIPRIMSANKVRERNVIVMIPVAGIGVELVATSLVGPKVVIARIAPIRLGDYRKRRYGSVPTTTLESRIFGSLRRRSGSPSSPRNIGGSARSV